VPASRQHWLGQFLAALWRDIRQTVPAGDMDALADHFGRRVEDAVKHPEKIPQLKILHRKKSRS
jgi:hypothetical protein